MFKKKINNGRHLYETNKFVIMRNHFITSSFFFFFTLPGTGKTWFMGQYVHPPGMVIQLWLYGYHYGYNGDHSVI